MVSTLQVPASGVPIVLNALLSVYLTCIYYIGVDPARRKPSGARQAQGVSPLRSLAMGIPSTLSKTASLATVYANVLLVLLAMDFTFRGHLLYPTDSLTFSRIGYVSTNMAKILVREPHADRFPLQLSYQHVGNNGSLHQLEIPALNESTDYTYPVTLSGLEANSRYNYSLSNNLSGEFTTAPSLNTQGASRLSFVTSSCIKPNFPYNPFSHPFRIPGLEILADTLARWTPTNNQPPSFMLFLGDFIYADVPVRFGDSVSAYRNEYRKVYASPSWHHGPDDQPSRLPWLHTLDDHEIANDWAAGSDMAPYPAAAEPYWDYHVAVNPPVSPASKSSIPDKNATYFQFTTGPASFFVCDTRTYRTPPSPDPQASMLGPTQLHALLRFLAAPEPRGVHWKVMATSVPFTRNFRTGGGFGRVARYRDERQDQGDEDVKSAGAGRPEAGGRANDDGTSNAFVSPDINQYFSLGFDGAFDADPDIDIDTWAGFPHERATILRAAHTAERRATGTLRVVLLSGDRHQFAATRFPDPEIVTAGRTAAKMKAERGMDEREDDVGGDGEGGEDSGGWRGPKAESQSVPFADLRPGPGRGVHEFSVGPLSMFYLPVCSYWPGSGAADAGDVPVKYVPEGNVKVGIVEIGPEGDGKGGVEEDAADSESWDEDGSGSGAATSSGASGSSPNPRSVLTYSLFVDGELLWQYRLSTTSTPAPDHVPTAESGGVHLVRALPGKGRTTVDRVPGACGIRGDEARGMMESGMMMKAMEWARGVWETAGAWVS